MLHVLGVRVLIAIGLNVAVLLISSNPGSRAVLAWGGSLIMILVLAAIALGLVVFAGSLSTPLAGTTSGRLNTGLPHGRQHSPAVRSANATVAP
jgi:hypothetical protein